MQRDVKVTLFKMKGRPNYFAQWVDPKGGKKKTRSTGKKVRRDAERVAGQLEKEINSGEYAERSRTTWADFRKRYESDVLAGLAEKTRLRASVDFGWVETILNPKLVAAIDSDAVSKLQRKLRDQGQREATIKGTLSRLRAALSWGHRAGLLNEVPTFEMPKRTAAMKGRPIVAEEFERMLKVVEKDRGEKFADGWRHFLRGLWLSGLRLGEALDLSWDDDRCIMVDYSGKRPMFRIQARAEKGKKFRLLPMTPDFAEFLESTPEDGQHGFVFNPIGNRCRDRRIRTDSAGSIISEFGRLANVKVAEHGDKVKYASAHDLRRAFGFRWSMRVRMPVLKTLMRHESITTTQQFYVGDDADATADEVWKYADSAKQMAKRDESTPKTAGSK